MTDHAFATDLTVVAPVPNRAFRDAMTSRSAVALTATLVLAAAAWVIAIRLMDGMDRMGGMAVGPATELGSFGFFAAAWIAMMAAMMLPGAALPVAARVRSGGRASVFITTYLGLWAVLGAVLYAVYRPHGSSLAGAIVIAAGIYELTPVKRRCREACRDGGRNGLGFGVCCVGSTIGLMAVLVALGLMSIFWMSVVAVVALAQKLLPTNRAVDVPLAAAIVALGIWIVVAPSSVPGLIPATPTMPAM
jgi:predicted metal-binding membrane protein